VHPIAFFYPAGHEAHSRDGHPERPERVEAVKRALESADLWQQGLQIAPQPIDATILRSVHSAEMLEAIQEYGLLERDYDLDTYLTKASWPLALNAAGGAAALAKAVWRGEAQSGFALTRPPGHHATRTQPMGFCLLNNIALAAQSLLQNEGAKRLAILDLDVHHGNGTQDIFYERSDVFFLSTHQSPLWPGTGQLGERGSGAGEGCNCCLPLPPFSGDEAFGVAYGVIALALLERIKPEMLLVSVGFDAHWKDPLANLQVSANGYAQAIASLREWAQQNCCGRIALFLEGGYDLDAAAVCGLAVTQALLGLPISDAIGPAPQPEGEQWMLVLEKAKKIWKINS
jgi:acetoin utilization deacetylase AcuC-like enzyme